MSAVLKPYHRLQRRGLLLGLVALAVYLLAALTHPRTALQSWYAATLFWTSLPLGALALLLIHHLTAGRWGWYVRPLLLAAIATLPLLLLAYIPLLLAVKSVFPWTAAAAELPDVVQQKLAYLNLPFFLGRTGLYFAIWLLLAIAAGAFRSNAGGRRYRLASVGLILYGLTITFFGVDWVQSVDPQYYSSTIGYLLAASQFVAVMAFVIAAATMLDLPGVDGEPAPLHDLGNLLLSAVMLWMYIVFMKYIVIWSADMPHEIRWYLHRQQGWWLWLTVLLILLHFCLPFFLLLFRRIKQSRLWLGLLAAGLLAAHALEVCWLLLPSFPQRPPLAGVSDAAALLGLGGLWLALFLWWLQRGARTEARHG